MAIQKIQVTVERTFTDGWPEGPPEASPEYSPIKNRLIAFRLSRQYDSDTDGDIREFFWNTFIALKGTVEGLPKATNWETTGMTLPNRNTIAYDVASAVKLALSDTNDVICEAIIEESYAITSTV